MFSTIGCGGTERQQPYEFRRLFCGDPPVGVGLHLCVWVGVAVDGGVLGVVLMATMAL